MQGIYNKYAIFKVHLGNCKPEYPARLPTEKNISQFSFCMIKIIIEWFDYVL